jgi:hypothetical protein
MTNRASDLRREAAQCLALAKTVTDRKAREELIHMAARFHEMATTDVGAILQVFKDAGMTRARQHQSETEESESPPS